MRMLLSVFLIAAVSVSAQFINPNVQQQYEPIGQTNVESTVNIPYQQPMTQIAGEIDPVTARWNALVAQQKWNQINVPQQQQSLMDQINQFGMVDQTVPIQQQLVQPHLKQQFVPLTFQQQQEQPIESSLLNQMKLGLAGVSTTGVPVQPIEQQLLNMGIDVNTLTPSQLERVQNLLAWNAKQTMQQLKYGTAGAKLKQLPIEQESMFMDKNVEKMIRGSMTLPELSSPFKHSIQFQRLVSFPVKSKHMPLMSRVHPSRMMMEESDLANMELSELPVESQFLPSEVELEEDRALPTSMTMPMSARELLFVPRSQAIGEFGMTPRGWGHRGGFMRGGFMRGGLGRGFMRGGFMRGGFYNPYMMPLPIAPVTPGGLIVVNPYESGAYGWEDPYFSPYNAAVRRSGAVELPVRSKVGVASAALREAMLRARQTPNIEQIQNVRLA